MPPTEAVLVTGASTGIGRAVVERLATDGHRVFAAVRDLSSVEPHPLVAPIRLDVTSAEQAQTAAAEVREALGAGVLRGIVNNAGIAVGGPLEVLDLNDLRRQLEVNVIGQLAVTQAFLPLLRDGIRDPRIVFTGSISSRVALPFVGPYAASKFGLLAMATSLRRELRPWGFKVTVIEPGTIATPIWDKGTAEIDALDAALPPQGRALYGDTVAGMRNVMSDSAKSGIPPSAVADVVHTALFGKRPRTEYLVGADAKVMAVASAVLPVALFDRLIAREFERRFRD